MLYLDRDTIDEVELDWDPLALLEAIDIVVREDISMLELIKLQLYKWHAIEAIKWRPVAASWYKKER